MNDMFTRRWIMKIGEARQIYYNNRKQLVEQMSGIAKHLLIIKRCTHFDC